MGKRPIRRETIALVALIFSVCLSACGNSIPIDSIFDRGETLRVHASSPVTLDPAHIGDSVSWQYAIQLYSGLVKLDNDLDIVPDLAESWELSSDGRTYRFKLRGEAQFHSGRRVVAGDFVYAYERALRPSTKSTIASQYLGDIVGAQDFNSGAIPRLTGVRAVDAQTLEITIDGSKSYFLAKLTHPVGFPLDRANVESGDRWFERPNGTGPFRMNRWVPNDRMVIQRFNQHWLGPARVKDVEFNFSPIPGIVLYEQGEVDVTEIDLSSLDRISDPSNPLSKERITKPLLSTWYVGMNTRMPPFDDPLVRQAFAMATDRNRLVEVFFKSTRALADSILPLGLPGKRQEVRAVPLDIAGARSTLARSRYARNMPEVVLSVGEGSSSTGEAIAEMYVRNLGIDVGVREYGVDYYQVLDRHEAQMFVTGWIADYPHPQNFLDILFHSRSNGNYGSFQDSEVDQVLEQARIETSEGLRNELYARAEARILSQAAVIPIHHEVIHALARPYVRGLVWTSLGILSYHNVEVGTRTVRRAS